MDDQFIIELLYPTLSKNYSNTPQTESKTIN